MSKNENHEFKNIKYILTSTMRTKLIISIYEKEKNLEELRNELKKPSATILHGLKELENLNFVKKINKNYSLTSNGYLLAVNMLKLIENWYSINITNYNKRPNCRHGFARGKSTQRNIPNAVIAGIVISTPNSIKDNANA